MSDRQPARDDDPEETREWLDALAAVHREAGPERARFLLRRLEQGARDLGLAGVAQPYSAYRNTIPLEQQPPYPGDLALEERITALMRWNALAMVVRANHAHGELGGHIASYASAAEIFELGFNHFFRGAEAPGGADLVYFQPHSAPGIYARAFLEGRLNADQLAHYRQEVDGRGLCSYPHPWLMPTFWQFPTGSMGIGPINAIYQARFLRYLAHRGIVPERDRHVWGVFGDGEMDEPESMAALTLAARERLDNLTFVINCNLQRLDGPVRGNGQIIQELEALFAGAGWNVIKVLWGSDWDPLFARDHGHALLRKFADTVDGTYQTLGAKDGSYNLEHFFREDPALSALVAHMSDAEVDALRRGGHDFRKLFAAFASARAHPGQPTVILAKTKKGFGMGGAGESRMTSHQTKKLDLEALETFRDRFSLPLTDEALERLDFYRPEPDSAELAYLRRRREALGGPLPRRETAASPLDTPPAERFAAFALGPDGKVMSTTMALTRMLTQLLRDPTLGPRVVPIVADEARTFGMASLFRQIGIYSSTGQLYEPEDAGSLLSYREARDGQLLEEGITEAGAISSWAAAATAYSVHGEAMLPFYIYYSMFGFQRVGDLIWAAADQRARGFLIGATAGRTTLSGEGLQHQDGASHVMAATVPNCRSWDPAFAGELAVIVAAGMREMLSEQRDVFYYITVMNESYAQPDLPPEAAADVLRGLRRLSGPEGEAPVRLLGSGAILPEVIAAAELLREDWGVAAEVFSATSYTELARDAEAVARQRRLDSGDRDTSERDSGDGDSAPGDLADGNRSSASAAEQTTGASQLQRLLPGSAPIIAASDYVRAWPGLIAPHLDAPFLALGTDGFGRSDTRRKLRRHFEVDREHVCLAALKALADAGIGSPRRVREAILRYGLDADAPPPWER